MFIYCVLDEIGNAIYYSDDIEACKQFAYEYNIENCIKTYVFRETGDYNSLVCYYEY